MNDTQPSLGEMRAAHRSLMGLYGEILLGLERLSGFVRPAPDAVMASHWFSRLVSADSQRSKRINGLLLGIMRVFTLRALIQPFSESHISKRLLQLERTYAFMGQVRDDDEVKRWTREAREEMAEVRDYLTSWASLRSLTKLIGGPIAAIATAVGIGALLEWLTHFGGETLTWGAMGAFGLGLYALFFGARAFSHKRAMFLNGTREPRESEAEAAESSVNVYRAERGFWTLLDIRRKPEPAIDLFVVAGSWAIFAALAIAPAIRLVDAPAGRVALAAIGLLFLWQAFGRLRQIPRRDWN